MGHHSFDAEEPEATFHVPTKARRSLTLTFEGSRFQTNPVPDDTHCIRTLSTVVTRDRSLRVHVVATDGFAAHAPLARRSIVRDVSTTAQTRSAPRDLFESFMLVLKEFREVESGMFGPAGRMVVAADAPARRSFEGQEFQ